MAAYNPLALGQMLVGTGGLVFAAYLWCYSKLNSQKEEDAWRASQEKGYGIVFFLLGLMSTVFAFDLYLTGVTPGQYVEIYGVGYFLFGLMMLAAGTTMYTGADKRPVAWLAVPSGVMLLLCAYNLVSFKMGKHPKVAGLLFGLAGLSSLAGALAAFTYQKNRKVILLAALVFAGFGVLAMFNGLMAQNGHISTALAAAAKAAAEKAAAAAAAKP